MVEGNDKNNLPEGGSGAAMPPVPAFTPGIVWKAMGFFWQFPDWHGARGRGKKAGWVFRHKMIDADEPESVLAERTLAEIRSLLSGVIGCASLYRSNLAPNLSGYAKLNRAIQAMCEINKKSLALHDRVRLILPLSSQIEGDCIICALFRTFRSLVLTRIFDDECGTDRKSVV